MRMPTFNPSMFGQQMAPGSGLMEPPMPQGGSLLRSIQDEATQKAIKQREEKSQKLMEQAQRLQAESAQLKAPAPTNPLQNPRDLILPAVAALIGKLFFHSKDADIAGLGQGFLGARQDAAARQDQANQQNFQTQRQGLLTGAQSAMQGSQFEQDAADRLTNQQRYEQGRTDKLAADASALKEKNLAAAEAKYYNANTPSEKRIAAQKWAALDPQFAPGTDQVEADVRDMQVKNLQSASNALGTQINRILQANGFIDDTNGKALDAQAEAIAKQYGVDRAQLPVIPSGESLRKQAFENHKAEFDKTFQFRSKEANIRDAQGWARIDALHQQIEIARQNLGMRGASLGLAERRFQFEIQKTAGGLLSSHTKELTKARTDLAREESVLDQMRARGVKVGLGAGIDTPGSPEAQQAEKVQHLRDEVKAWEDMAKAAQEEYQDASGAAPQGAPPAPEANVTPGQGGNVPVQIGGLPSGPIGKPPKSQNSQKSHQPKSKPKASAPKGETVYNQGGVTVRKRS